MLGNYGLRRLVFSSISVSRHHYSYSTASSGTNLIVDYLISKLGFSSQEAISAASKYKVTHLRSTSNADSVVNLFKDYGLDQTQIRDVVSSMPQILSCNFDRTLEPKIRVLQELGLSGSDLVKLIKRQQTFLGLGLNTKIIPMVGFLRELLGSDEKVIEAINNSLRLFSSFDVNRLSENMLVLQRYGLSDEEIQSFVVKNVSQMKKPPEWLQSKLDWLQRKLGTPCESRVFVRCFNTVASTGISAMEMKMGVYKSFGWSDLELSSLFRTQPICFVYSEANICDKLNFLMKEQGLTAAYLITLPSLLTYSLEKRLKPRFIVLKILKEKMLVDGSKPFLSVLQYTEREFQKFVQRFENEIPGLYEIYTGSIRSAQDK